MGNFFMSMFSLISPLFADEVAPAASSGNYLQTLVMIGVALVFFYFILWRPEQKRRKKAESLRSSLKKGDRVTAMGIIGIVARITDTTVILKMCDGAKVEFLKGAISDVQPCSSEESAKIKEEVAAE
jgi:preprotein translocase subunit YajC